MSYGEFVREYPYWAGILKALLAFAVIMNVVPLLVYFERRLCAWIQDRLGPDRVGPKGLLQPLADVVKLALKEDLTPRGVDRAIYTLAPAIVYIPSLLAFAVIPMSIETQVANFNVGVVYLLTVGSLGVYGIAFGGWSSNNKFGLLGGLRSSAQMISYEIALGMAVICVILMSSSVDLNVIVIDQYREGFWGFLGWNAFQQPMVFLLFFTAAFAETNRLPFDLPECEAELVGGYHTEYSSLKFALFFLGEYVAMITMSALAVTLFLGGWTIPGFLGYHAVPGWDHWIAGLISFGVKTGVLLFFFIWVRWTLPRFRYDQLMDIGWKGMIPLTLVLIAVTAAMIIVGWKSYVPLANLAMMAILGLVVVSRHGLKSDEPATATGH